MIEWLTSFDENRLQELINEKVTFETFFQKATLHPNAHHVKGEIYFTIDFIYWNLMMNSIQKSQGLKGISFLQNVDMLVPMDEDHL